MNEDQDNVAAVLQWIGESQGEYVAHVWLWQLTPFPRRWPNPDQLHDGMRLAAGEVTIGELLAKRHAERLSAHVGTGGDA